MVGYRDPTYWLRNDWYEPCPVKYLFLLYRHLSLVCCWIYVEGQSDNGSPHWGVCFAASWLSERIDWQSSKSFMAQKLFALLAERLHVLNFAHAKPYNTSLPNHHSCCFVG